MSLDRRIARLESRTGAGTDEITLIRRVIVQRDADGLIQVSGVIERDLRTGEIRRDGEIA